MATVEQMLREKQAQVAPSSAGTTRIPRRALFACLRGMTAEEFDDHMEARRADPR